uniref:L,D-transpeptidase n=1 Tax=candidate division WOR-3 bacterium TaxID=2052148 RepID=A0A7C4GIC1_UNCW3
MKPTPVQSVGIIVLAALAVAWSELQLPVRESVGYDVPGLAVRLWKMRLELRENEAELVRLQAETARLKQTVTALAGRFAAAFTEEVYIAVSTADNRLYARRGQDVLREAVISTGSGDTLRQGKRSWIFETPRGVLRVIRKKAGPVWVKPDWAFLEKGEPIPPWDSPLRRQKGVLGDYLLDLGGGVAIHGTDKEHLLGQSVTHGCIRVGKDDIKFLYDSIPVGTKVYIY